MAAHQNNYIGIMLQVMCKSATADGRGNHDHNIISRAILAWVPRDAGKGHWSPTSVPGWSKLQIGVVVEAVKVRVT